MGRLGSAFACLWLATLLLAIPKSGPVSSLPLYAVAFA